MEAMFKVLGDRNLGKRTVIEAARSTGVKVETMWEWSSSDHN
jgi:hypothetical protein